MSIDIDIRIQDASASDVNVALEEIKRRKLLDDYTLGMWCNTRCENMQGFKVAKFRITQHVDVHNPEK